MQVVVTMEEHQCIMMMPTPSADAQVKGRFNERGIYGER
jgi:hypothetical protein